MGKIDAYAKTFMAHPEVFAEFYNFLFWRNGDELFVNGDSLEEKDSGVTVALAGQLKQYMERRNDLVRQAYLYDNKDGGHVIMCLEIQSFVKYEQALQNVVCIAIRAVQAAQILAHQHEQEHCMEGSPLQLLKKNDVLPTMLQAVLYLGDTSWTAQENLQNLMDIPLEQMGKYLVNCPASVVSLVDLTDAEISFLKTELRALAIFIKYSKDTKKLQYYLDHDPMFQHLSGDAVRLIRECTHITIKKKIKQEDNNMCLAIDEMIEIGTQKGYLRGKKERNEKLQQKLQQKDIKIKKMGEQLQKKDSQLQKKDSQLQKKDSQLQKKDHQIQNYEQNRIALIRYFLLLGKTNKEIAEILNISVDRVQKSIESLNSIPISSDSSIT